MNPDQNARDALPDYLNGRADPAGCARIAALLESDPAFAEDAALMVALRDALRAEAQAIDGDAGLAALRQRIAKPSPWRHVRHFFDLLSRPVLAPAIMASLALVCAVQGWMLWQEPQSGEVTWRGAPGSTLAPAPATLQVRFDDQATMAQIEAALKLAHARIIDGPLADGSYLLEAAVPVFAHHKLRQNAVVREVRAVPVPSASK